MGIITQCLMVMLLCQAIGMLKASDDDNAQVGEAQLHDEELFEDEQADDDMLAFPDAEEYTDEEMAAMQFAGTFEKRGKAKCRKPKSKGTTNQNALNAQIVDWHNYYRCLHGVGKVTYSKTLERTAKKNVQANTPSGMQHTSRNDYGENLWAKWRSGRFGMKDITGQNPVKDWYDEIRDYNFRTPTQFSGATGHFTQVVWKDTKKIGCWTGTNPDQGMTRVYTACEYDPPGNMNTFFDNKKNWLKQVPKPK